jgi:phenylalanine-4-hydroxylase
MGPFDVPPHLRQYVVQQDYDQYTVVDQAVWRFVLLQTYARLRHTAHEAYATGFDAVGISVERIPRIAEMNERLGTRSFQAVCVDGFIPPRAFQAFQARGMLPIACDIRTSKHLAYTPAPDIIHEAAGHAPFLAHPEYAHFLRRIGAIGERTFSNAHDRAVYQAIYALSEQKENPTSSAEQLARAEAEVARLHALPGEPSEAALLARLYWWTVEYGLVGTPRDYRLYGAGLLSSLGEGHSCHAPQVRKLPLDASCIEVAYDITRPQPQLFVARDFEHLDGVLDEVARGFAFRLGGPLSLQRALESGEPACLELSSGAQLIGTVQVLHGEPARPNAIELAGQACVALEFEQLSEWPRRSGYVLPLGELSDGTSLDAVRVECLRRHVDANAHLSVRLAGGLEISGRWLETREQAGRVIAVLLGDALIRQAGRVLLRAAEPYAWLLAGSVRAAHAELPGGYYQATEFPSTQVPAPRAFSTDERRLIGLYEQALSALRASFGAEVVPHFEAICGVLAQYPEEWLLRWNLLESLIKLGHTGRLARALEVELEQLEIRFAGREPIATGLAYLHGLGAAAQLAPGESEVEGGT